MPINQIQILNSLQIYTCVSTTTPHFAMALKKSALGRWPLL